MVVVLSTRYWMSASARNKPRGEAKSAWLIC